MPEDNVVQAGRLDSGLDHAIVGADAAVQVIECAFLRVSRQVKVESKEVVQFRCLGRALGVLLVEVDTGLLQHKPLLGQGGIFKLKLRISWDLHFRGVEIIYSINNTSFYRQRSRPVDSPCLPPLLPTRLLLVTFQREQ